MKKLLLIFAALVLFSEGKAAASIKLAEPTELMLWIPREGTPVGMLTQVCKTNLRAPAPLVIINHGSPPRSGDRASRKPSSCGEVAHFFTSRGYNVAFPLRRGYGETGGKWAETYGRCDSADFVSGGQATADDIAAAIDFLLQQPYVAKTGTIVVGQSAGGWGTLALASRNPRGIATFINFAGGRGAEIDPNGGFDHCSPEALIGAAKIFGMSARQPSLWIYTENDLLVPSELSNRLHTAYVAGGGPANYALLGPYRDNGHNLFFGKGGSHIWGPLVDRWLAEHLQH